MVNKETLIKSAFLLTHLQKHQFLLTIFIVIYYPISHFSAFCISYNSTLFL